MTHYFLIIALSFGWATAFAAESRPDRSLVKQEHFSFNRVLVVDVATGKAQNLSFSVRPDRAYDVYFAVTAVGIDPIAVGPDLLRNAPEGKVPAATYSYPQRSLVATELEYFPEVSFINFLGETRQMRGVWGLRWTPEGEGTFDIVARFAPLRDTANSRWNTLLSENLDDTDTLNLVESRVAHSFVSPSGTIEYGKHLPPAEAPKFILTAENISAPLKPWDRQSLRFAVRENNGGAQAKFDDGARIFVRRRVETGGNRVGSGGRTYFIGRVAEQSEDEIKISISFSDIGDYDVFVSGTIEGQPMVAQTALRVEGSPPPPSGAVNTPHLVCTGSDQNGDKFRLQVRGNWEGVEYPSWSAGYYRNDKLIGVGNVCGGDPRSDQFGTFSCWNEIGNGHGFGTKDIATKLLTYHEGGVRKAALLISGTHTGNPTLSLRGLICQTH